ncbi:hypothetical protein CKAH01_11956 [Colletotrichum kahawae]|uniref:Uncharacterized protein n=1 Tax=Colletotrichum kahawae TaxID=34407 RepID=A0AAE0DDA5_COLKA|nr:hypothetical protein CKAH01_11956 [Colletotrichum kahawae]
MYTTCAGDFTPRRLRPSLCHTQQQQLTNLLHASSHVSDRWSVTGSSPVSLWPDKQFQDNNAYRRTLRHLAI